MEVDPTLGPFCAATMNMPVCKSPGLEDLTGKEAPTGHALHVAMGAAEVLMWVVNSVHVDARAFHISNMNHANGRLRGGARGSP